MLTSVCAQQSGHASLLFVRFVACGVSSQDTPALSLVRALVVSKVDYCNSVLLLLISGNLIRRLQSVMNAAARLVFSAKSSDHITPLLRELRWLKVPERIQFRLGVLVYRCLHNRAPAYLAESLQLVRDVHARRRLRSAESMKLIVPATRCSTLGDRAFPVSAARTWNALPSSVRAAPSLATFRQKLKQTLFLLRAPKFGYNLTTKF